MKSTAISRKFVFICVIYFIVFSFFANAVDPIPQNNLPQFKSGTWTTDVDQAKHLPKITSFNQGDQTVSKMLVEQLKEKAVFNWESFNIGKNSEVEFLQVNSDAIALNKIFSQDPSQILGSLKANGSVYLINPNGILFGEDALVDVNGLIASTLQLTDEDQYFINGSFAQAISNSEAAFENKYFTDKDGNPIKPDFIDDDAIPEGGIIIDAGAEIRSKSGSSVFLFGTKVENSGKIEVEDGQVLVVATKDKIYLVASDLDPKLRGFLVEVSDGGNVTNHASGEIIARRGNATLLGQAVNQQGRVSATTSVSVNGSVRLIARSAPRETGAELRNIIEISGLDSSIPEEVGSYIGLGPLVDGASGQTVSAKVLPVASVSGEVNISGSNSVTEVTVEDSSDVAVDAQVQEKPIVEIMGGDIAISDGASVSAKGGLISLRAVEKPAQAVNPGIIDTDSKIAIGDDVTLDVSGYSDDLPISRRTVSVKLTGTELRDAPLQRDGPLRNETITVDVSKGTDFADIQGELDNITRSVEERLSEGGDIEMLSDGNVFISQSAKLDLSGGEIRHAGGLLETSKLIYQGSIVDISEADPNIIYEGLVDPRFPGWQEAVDPYVEGKNAGHLGILGASVDFFGSVEAKNVSGPLQREMDKLPHGGSLYFDIGFFEVGFESEDDINQNIEFVSEEEYLAFLDELENEASDLASAPIKFAENFFNDANITDTQIITPGAVTLTEDAHLLLPKGANFDLVAGRVTDNPMSTDSMGSESTNSETGSPLEVSDPTEEDLSAAIHIFGKISSTGGNVSFETRDFIQFDGSSPKFFDDRPIIFYETAEVDLRGELINDSPAVVGKVPELPMFIDGGNFSALAAGSLIIENGVEIDTSAGLHIDSDGILHPGVGGDISLQAQNSTNFRESKFLNDGIFKSYAMQQGGSLFLQAPAFEIGQLDNSNAVEDNVLYLSPDLFNSFGFSLFELRADLEGTAIKAGTEIEFQQLNYLDEDINGLNSIFEIPLGAAVDDYFSLGQAFDYERQPVDLKITSNFLLGTNSSLTFDPGANIDISGRGLLFDGKIIAPGASVSIASAGGRIISRQTGILLGRNSVIDVSGRLISLPTTDDGQVNFKAVDGGTVSLSAINGFILQEFGSLVNASGAFAFAELAQTDLRGLVSLAQVPVVAKPGNIELSTVDSMILDGVLLAQAADLAGQAGGTLRITMNPEDLNTQISRSRLSGLSNNVQKIYAPTIKVGSDPKILMPEGIVERDSTSAELTGFGDVWNIIQNAGFDGVLQQNAVYLSEKNIEGGGFGALELEVRNAIDYDKVPREILRIGGDESYGSILFIDELDLGLDYALNLKTPHFVVDEELEGKNIRLSAPYLSIGNTFENDSFTEESLLSFDVIEGDNLLSFDGEFIDLFGVNHVSGANFVTLEGRHGVRLNSYRGNPRDRFFPEGSFSVPLNLNVVASQVSPVTLNSFRFHSEPESGGRIAFAPSRNDPETVLSIGGSISVEADEIIQGSALFAPLGTINLQARDKLILEDSSITSVSLGDEAVPFGRTQALGSSWIYEAPLGNFVLSMAPDESQGEIILPQKNIRLSSDVVDLQSGAVIDLSGGGTVFASEFIPGPGGSADVLDGNSSGESFAIVRNSSEGFNSLYAPVDRMEDFGSQYNVGQTITVTGSDLVPDGEYAILPPRYALLPNAYLVTPTDVTQMGEFDELVDVDGTKIVAGKFGSANTDLLDSSWSGFRIEKGEIALQRSQLLLSDANRFFSQSRVSSAVQLPSTGGNLTLFAESGLTIEADVLAQGFEDNAGSLAVSADNLVLSSDNAFFEEDSVGLSPTKFGDFSFRRLLFGGSFELDSSGLAENIIIESDSIKLGENEVVSASELILVAKEEIQIGENAAINSTGEAIAESQIYGVDGEGSIVAVSSNTGLSLVRTDLPESSEAFVELQNGATMSSDAAIILDTSGKLSLLNGSFVAGQVKQLSLGAAALSIGDDLGLEASLLDVGLFSGNYEDINLRSAAPLIFSGNLDIAAQNISIDSPGFVSHQGMFDVTLNASAQVALKNFGIDPEAMELETTEGKLAIWAESILLGSSDLDLGIDTSFSLSGFDSVELNASSYIGSVSDFSFYGDGVTELYIDTPLLSLLNGSDTLLQFLSAALSFDNTFASESVPNLNALGSSLDVIASAVEINSSIVLPSGKLRVLALGKPDEVTAGEDDTMTGMQDDVQADGLAGIQIGEQAFIDLSGTDFLFEDLSSATEGGSFNLQSLQGPVNIVSSAMIDVSGSQGGEIHIDAKDGLTFTGDSLWAENGGSLSLSAPNISASVISQMSTSRGFNRSVDVALSEGEFNLAAAETIVSERIKIVADSGAIILHGDLDASGAVSGSVELIAREDIEINETTSIDASVDVAGTNAPDTDIAQAKGGLVKIESREGSLRLAEGSLINVSSNSETEQGGKVKFRLSRDNLGDSVLNSEVRLSHDNSSPDDRNAGELSLEIYQFFDMDEEESNLFVSGILNEDIFAALVEEANTYLSNIDTSSLGRLSEDPYFQIKPGIEIHSSESITIELVNKDLGGILFTDYRFGDSDSGAVLTISSAEDVSINDPFGDGLGLNSYLSGALNRAAPADLCVITPGCEAKLDVITAGMWDFNFTAGRDFESADVLSVIDGAGDINFAENSLLTTGVGDINISAGKDINLADTSVGIYTHGRIDNAPTLETVAELIEKYPPSAPPFNGDGSLLNMLFEPDGPGIPLESLGLEYFPNVPIYPEFGGNINIEANGDLLVVDNSKPRSHADWLMRVGSDAARNELLPTWAIIPNKFFGIAAMGGGDTHVRVGGKIQDVLIAAPNTGQPNADVTLQSFDEFGSTIQVINEAEIFEQSKAEVILREGGNFEVIAGSNIIGTQFLIGNGIGKIRTDAGVIDNGEISSIFTLGGGANLDVSARRNILIESVQDQTRAPQSRLQQPPLANQLFDYHTSFFSYDDETSVSIRSVGGDIVHVPAKPENFSYFPDTENATNSFIAAPPNYNLTAYSGDVSLGQQIILFPSATGTFELLAGKDLIFESIGAETGNISVRHFGSADSDPLSLPNVTFDETNIGSVDLRGSEGGDIELLFGSNQDFRNLPRKGVHTNPTLHIDDSRANYVVAREGQVVGNGNVYFSPKSTVISAGSTLRNLGLNIQNTSVEDVSIIKSQTRDVVFELVRDSFGDIRPTNTNDPRSFLLDGPGEFLIQAGNDIDLGNSLGIIMRGQQFNLGLPEESANLTLIAGANQQFNLEEFRETYLDEITAKAELAVADYLALSEKQKLILDLEFLLAEVRLGGVENATLAVSELDADQGFARSYGAIERMFPGEEWDGNIELAVSKIQSLEDGGVKMFAPGGEINVGAPTELVNRSSGSSEVDFVKGIVALGRGSIEAIAQGDVNVNKERIFTLQGGDIMLWSSEADIDAGKGATTSITIPPPRVIIDAEGKVSVEFPPAISGSGIAALSTPDIPEDELGSVFLFAPSGVIDAGDAGIRTSGDAILAAQAVLNAENIEVGGVSIGVPVSSGISAAVAGASAAAASAADSASDTVSESIASNSSSQEVEAYLSVEVLNESDGCDASLDDEFCN